MNLYWVELWLDLSGYFRAPNEATAIAGGRRLCAANALVKVTPAMTEDELADELLGAGAGDIDPQDSVANNVFFQLPVNV